MNGEMDGWVDGCQGEWMNSEWEGGWMGIWMRSSQMSGWQIGGGIGGDV